MATAAGSSPLGGVAHGFLPVSTEPRDAFDDALDKFLFNHAGTDFLQLSPEEDQMLHPLQGVSGAGGHDMLTQGVKVERRTPLTRVAFSTGDLESMSYVHGHAKTASSGFTQRYSAAPGGNSSLLFEPLVGGGTPFTVDECDETGADFAPPMYTETPGGVPLHMFTLQQPGVTVPRSLATTRPRSQLSRQPHSGLTAPGVVVSRKPAAQTTAAVPLAPAAQSTTSHVASTAAAKAPLPTVVPVKTAKDSPPAPARPANEPTRTSQRRLIPSVGTASRPSALRRVHSTGDLSVYSLHGGSRLQTGLGGDGKPDSMDDGIYRIGKYTLEERRLRILRYRQKRHERNFDRKIKYACRKTLADSRPRVRGRFAKNEDGPVKGMPSDGMDLPLDEDDLESLDFDEDELMAHKFTEGVAAVGGWGPTPAGGNLAGDVPPIDRFSGTSQGVDGGRREQQSPLAGIFP